MLNPGDHADNKAMGYTLTCNSSIEPCANGIGVKMQVNSGFLFKIGLVAT